MKTYTLLIAFLIASSITVAQTTLSLKINHKLDTTAFALNTTKANNLGNQLTVKRLQYYLTVVSVTHDGGTVTPINKVLLVDADVALLDSLTSMTITTLEKVTLAVGVDSSLNHLDPSLYPSSHPLSPKSPSMHWGWTPGYRFVALEGEGAVSGVPSNTYELHALGDHNYHYTTITTAGVTTTGKKTIELNANYLGALHDINVSSGLVEHGETPATKKVLENFKLKVFTSIEGNPSVGVNSIPKENIDFTISPNPTLEGQQVIIETKKLLENSTLVIVDLKGRVITEQPITSKKTVLSTLTQGVYICSIKKNNEVLGSKKMIVTQ